MAFFDVLSSTLFVDAIPTFILIVAVSKQAINGAAQGKNHRLKIWTSSFEAQNYISVCSNVAQRIFMKFHTLALRANSVFMYRLIDVSETFILCYIFQTSSCIHQFGKYCPQVPKIQQKPTSVSLSEL